MIKLRLVNNFHNTETTIHVPESGKLTATQVRRARRALCGVTGCTCGGELGERGPQVGSWTLEHINGGICIRRG
jgi:hypothetical protein